MQRIMARLAKPPLKVTVRDLKEPETVFPPFFKPPEVKIISQGKMGEACPIEGGSEIRVARAWPLETCAAVIYIVPEKCYLLHHAAMGALKPQDIKTAFDKLGKKLGKVLAKEEVFCVYAHPGSDEQYTKDADELIKYGLPDNQVFEVYNVDTHQFGINNLGELGY